MKTKNQSAKLNQNNVCPECEKHKSDKKNLLVILGMNKIIPEWLTELLISWGNLKDA